MTVRPLGTRAALAALLTLVLWGTQAPLSAQTTEEAWNGKRVLELVRRARLLRRSTVVDTAFRSYRSEARGYVYFFIDRPDSDEQTLVKADQIALELFWQAPNETWQRIVGLRDQKVLPTNIRYHLDHLTVVQDDFGDRIRLGDGDEVSQVVHPLGPGAAAIYDFRLADSLSLRYGGGAEEVRVYEVLVRPREPDRPGFVGSVYLDRSTAAVVRMNFTFTPASYVDPYLDYIRISMDNALWMGKYWLPYRQEAELRRELPQLDFLAGSIIRGRFEIGGYDFNLPPPPNAYGGQRISAAPQAEREAFPFEQGLFDDLDQEGLGPTPNLEDIRAQARQIVTDRALSGLSPYRFHFRSVSDVVRYDRAEGLYLGAGLQLRPQPTTQVRLSAGYAIERARPSFGLAATGESTSLVPVLDLYWDELRDLGTYPGTAPVLATLGTAFGGEDYRDPFFARGMRVTMRGARPDAGPELSVRWEDHTSAENVLAGDTRPIRPVEEGILGAVALKLPLSLPGGGRARVTGTVGRLGDRTFGASRADLEWKLERPDRAWRFQAQLGAGAATQRTPVQELYLLGGRGTLPGYDYRSFVGRRFWLARVEASHPLLPPWVGFRTFAALGSSHLADATLPEGWDARDSGGLRASVGAGLSFGWDVLRLDLARGLRDGRWEIIFAVDSRFYSWL